MPITKEEVWQDWVNSNKDPYGKACVDVARDVMRMLDAETPIDTHKIICDADKNVNAGGITGFMAGAVAQMVSQCHSRGEEFRKAWNKDHGVNEEQAKGGVVNPAIMTIKTKEGSEK
jgi:hypothetical protein